MMLLDLLKAVLPKKMGHSLGLWAIKQAVRSKFLAYPYVFFLCGKMPRNLTMVSGDGCYVTHEGRRVYSPRDGILRFVEIFQDNVYEKFGSPAEGDVVFDIGAYVGMFSVKASSQVGAKGKVVAVEPDLDNIKYLDRNIKGIGNIIKVCKAASNSKAKVKLHLSDNSACHSLLDSSDRDFVWVLTDTLDNIKRDLRLAKVDFIKIDAEGSELEILKGAEKVLKGKPKLSIASYHNLSNGKPEQPEIIRFLKDRGYRINATLGYVYAEK